MALLIEANPRFEVLPVFLLEEREPEEPLPCEDELEDLPELEELRPEPELPRPEPELLRPDPLRPEPEELLRPDLEPVLPEPELLRPERDPRPLEVNLPCESRGC